MHTQRNSQAYIHQLMRAKVGVGSTGYHEYARHPELALEKKKLGRRQNRTTPKRGLVRDGSGRGDV